MLKSRQPKQSSHVANMCLILKYAGIEHETEYKFAENRRFKFDIAIPSIKVAIEYEGIFSEKARHTTATGYTGDCEKYNIATILGWRVLRYTALNVGDFYKDISSIIHGKH